MNHGTRISQLRCLIWNDAARLAWMEVAREEFYADGVPANFHAQCILARQILRGRQEQLAQLFAAVSRERELRTNTGPAAAGNGATSPAAQPATL